MNDDNGTWRSGSTRSLSREEPFTGTNIVEGYTHWLHSEGVAGRGGSGGAGLQNTAHFVNYTTRQPRELATVVIITLGVDGPPGHVAVNTLFPAVSPRHE